MPLLKDSSLIPLSEKPVTSITWFQWKEVQFYALLYIQSLKLCLTYDKPSINICWMNICWIYMRLRNIIPQYKSVLQTLIIIILYFFLIWTLFLLCSFFWDVGFGNSHDISRKLQLNLPVILNRYVKIGFPFQSIPNHLTCLREKILTSIHFLKLHSENLFKWLIWPSYLDAKKLLHLYPFALFWYNKFSFLDHGSWVPAYSSYGSAI